MEKIEGVESAEVDWKGKQAEVFAEAGGFDPAQLPKAIRKAGFASPDAKVSIDVSVIGTVAAEEGNAVLVLPSRQWQLTGGEALDEVREAGESVAVRLRGALTLGVDGKQPTLEVASWEALSDD